MKAPTISLPPHKIEGLRRAGQKLWFEYHCLESKDSQDYPLWLHSHQKVKVLGIASNEGMFIPKFKERIDEGIPLVYKIKFADGKVAEAFEDELLDSPKKFSRPNPPRKEVTE